MSNNEKKEGNIVFKGKTEVIYKVIVIGDPATGKTEFLDRFAYNQDEYLHTIEPSTYKLAVTVGENREIYLIFWDMTGQHQFYMLHQPYFSGADGTILVFDITRSSTFSNINDWWNSYVKYGLESIPRVLVGILKEENSENERRIILPMGEHLSKKLNAPYFETSLDEEENIKLVVKTIVKLILESRGEAISLSNMVVELKPKDALQPKNVDDYPLIKRWNHKRFLQPSCPYCGASGKDIRTNRPPYIILDCNLDFPEYTCKKCGHEWGSLL